MKVEKLIDPERAAPLVRAYFKGVERPDGSLFTFSGAKFDTLARGGHRKGAADTITYDDLVAVSLLGVEIPPHTALLLLGPEARGVRSLLGRIPRLQRLAATEIDVLHEPDHPVLQLWTRLRSMPGMGPTKVSKLMARKRPHLIPVWDAVVGEQLGPIDDHWRRVHAIATEHGHDLAAIRRRAGVASGISLLRVLDSALWMRGEGARQVEKATGVDLLVPARKPKKSKSRKPKAKSKP